MRKVLCFMLSVAMTAFGAVSLAVAQYQPTSEQGKTQLKVDYLFQCDNAPTFEKAKQEIGYARQVAERIAKLEKAPNFSAQLAKLNELEKKIDVAMETKELAEDMYLAVRAVKREIVMRNPLINFDEILLIDNPYPNGKRGDATNEWSHEARHRNGFMAVDGGKLIACGLNPGEPKRVILDDGGSFWRPDLSFDAKKILLSHRLKGEESFHLFEMNLDGSGLKQLTFGDYDDLDPIYTPQGKIVFITSRQHSYVRCMPMTHAFVSARCDADGKNIYIISGSGEPEYLPSMMQDGRVIFTRWEYTDKPLWRVQSLWTMNPDGTNPQIFWGNQSAWPDVLTEARQIPGSKKVVFTGVGHHEWFKGSIGYINPDGGLDYPDGLQKITQEVKWAEVGDGPTPVKSDYEYHSAGKYVAYKTPYPLSEEYMLVSARDGGEREDKDFFNLYFQDVYGNKELIYKGEYNAYHAMPICPREVPLEKPDLVAWPKIGSGEKPKNGILYSNNVFEGAPPILKEKGKYLRVIQMDPKTYSTWYKTHQHDGPAVSYTQAEGVKRILGTVPIEADGSVNFQVPPGEAIYFEMLDENGMAIHVMRTFTSVMPGENRGCFGCHESNMSTRSNQMMGGGQMGSALRKPAVQLTLPSWGKESISYMRFVQPVLDRNCGKCHQDPNHEACKKLNMTCRPSYVRYWSWTHHRPKDLSPFCEPYRTLVGDEYYWSLGNGIPNRDKHGMAINLAGIYHVEANGNRFGGLKTLPPYSAFSPKSTLIHNATSGEHHGVKVSNEDAERLIAWVDCNGPYLGDEEIRAMYDPVGGAVEVPPIRPRVGTAPVINRFDVRQDGDAEAICGPLRIQPENERIASPFQEWLKFEIGDAPNKKLDGEIVAASWGNEFKHGKRVDVLEIVRKHQVNGSIFVDIPNRRKALENIQWSCTLRIKVRFNNGTEKEYIFQRDDDPIILDDLHGK